MDQILKNTVSLPRPPVGDAWCEEEIETILEYGRECAAQAVAIQKHALEVGKVTLESLVSRDQAANDFNPLNLHYIRGFKAGSLAARRRLISQVVPGIQSKSM